MATTLRPTHRPWQGSSARLAAALLLSLFLAAGNAQVGTASAQSETAIPSRVQSLTSTRASISVPPGRKNSYSIAVDPAKGWVDTQIPLRPGDQVSLSAAGSLQLSNGHTVTAAGAERGWKDMLRAFPLEGGNVGALIGRIGDGEATVPFAIGPESTLNLRQVGNLFVRANLSDDMSATGTLKLQVKLARPVAAAAVPKPSSEIAQLLSASTIDAFPRRVTDEDGTPGDVVNFALLGTQKQVEEAFSRSGWIAVDADANTAVIDGLFSTLQRKPYLAVPMSRLYLFGRPQDLSFARAEAIKVATVRHHLRVWKTDVVLDGRPMWIGSATYDNGLERDQRNGRMTHSIDPEIDKERDFLRGSFDASGALSSAAMVTPLDRVQAARTATGASFHTDGRIVVIALD